MFEMTSSLPNRRYGNALRRLGFDAEATDFYDEHVEADAVHENIAAHDLAGGLAREEPGLAPDILFGARALLLPRRPLRAEGAGRVEGRALLPASPAVSAGAAAGSPTAAYVLPLRWTEPGPIEELARYLRSLDDEVEEILVVDGSPPDLYDRHARALRGVARHLRAAPRPRLRGWER